MRVLVCGGRDYYDILNVRRVLNEIHAATPIDEILCGGASGADTFAYGWALRAEVTCIVVPAKWAQGKKAGPLRNQEMLDKWGADLVVAFPGGKGTADMVRRAERAGVEVRHVLLDESLCSSPRLTGGR